MDMVERYIAAVQRELPEDKRDDIGRELKANILDQIEALEAQQGQFNDSDVSSLLISMGYPRDVAITYYPPKPLIASSLMRLYASTLYMVLGVLFVISVIEVTSTWLGGSSMGIIRFVFAIASDFINSAIFAFSAITISFAVMSRSQTNENKPRTCRWSPEKLPTASKSWQHIGLDNIFTDLATLLFLILLIWYPLWRNDSNSLFSAEALQILRWFTPVIGVAVVHSLWQLRVRLWSASMLWLNIGVNTAFLVVSLILMQTQVLQIETLPTLDDWGINVAQYGINTILIAVAVISSYEVIRDARRIRRL
ncbi:hypothetical protein [Pseudidiomarina gelatinasegens]|uniref:hypothetical protein n=1 Tax=Pseudidiomarina gelatinasegens TaxID=2487740 RepID=UPI003A97B7D7